MSKQAHVDHELCMGCELCVQLCPEVFYMDGEVAAARDEICNDCDMDDIADQCPVEAISVDVA